MRHFLIDTDTASDDAVALIMALRDPEVEIAAITVVAGNVPVAQGVQNALYTIDLCGRSAKVYQGLAQPLSRDLETAQFVHGEDGMGDIGLDLKGRNPEIGDAIDVILNTVHRYSGEIELVTLGPLTNVATAITKDPAIVNKVKQCTIMGGVGIGHGNITPVSEYNIWTDPEAADIVFRSGMPIKMVGWDISRNHAWIDQAEADRLKALDTTLAHFALSIQKSVNDFAVNYSKLPGFDLPDPIAMAIALDPSVITLSKKLYVEVVLAEGVTRGQTVVDHIGVLRKEPNVEVVLEASREIFLSMLHDALK